MSGLQIEVMRRVNLPPKIVRLILLTFAIVGSYLVARAFFTPSSFNRYGWHRGDALEENAAHERRYAGRKACEECHSEEFPKLAKSEHKTISCETCHGPGTAHAEDPEVKMHKPADSDCMRCHGADVSRPAFLKQISLKDHFSGQRCIECHVPHQPTEVP